MHNFNFKITLTSFLILFFTPFVSFADSDVSDPEVGEEDTRPTFSGEILRIDESIADIEISELEKAGVRVLYRRGDLVLAFMPDEMTPEQQTCLKGKRSSNGPRLASRKFGKKRFRRNVETMDRSLELTEADKIRFGSSQSGSYDGTGVVVGFCDVGFDARHINFLNSAGTECRVRLVVDYDDDHGERNVYSTPREIYEWQTDNDDKFHATHVAGIMTGSYTRSGYHGVAPGADIVATTSGLSDVAILAGIEDVIAYAKAHDKPAVVNLSVGSYLGPHDGTSLFCQYIDRCAEDAVICISAGNEGNVRNHIEKWFTESDPKLYCVFANSKWDNLTMYGATDFYSDSEQPFTLRINVRDDHYGINNLEYSSPIPDFNETPVWTLTSDPEMRDVEGYCYSEKFAEYFQGEITLFGEVDPENGRYHIQVAYACETEILSDPNPWSLYRIDAEITGHPGQLVEGFADSTRSWFQGIPGYKFTPNSDFCISNLATAHNIVTVGMYYAHEGVMTESGVEIQGGEPYTVYKESGYATLRDGRVLPLTVAPGGPIISSHSSAYVAKNGSGDASFKTLPDFSQTELPDEEPPILYSPAYPLYDPEQYYYWLPCVGTSMSTPYVAGTIATWLQADRNLTSSRVREIIAATNETNIHSYDANPRHGMGYLQAYAGLMEVLKGVDTVVEVMADSRIRAWIGNGVLTVMNPAGERIRVDIYSVDGRLLRSCCNSAEEMMNISLSDLPKGISIATIFSESGDDKARCVKTIKIVN